MTFTPRHRRYTPQQTGVPRPNWNAIRAVIHKDNLAIRRSKAVMIPMLVVPTILLVVVPFLIGLTARGKDAGVESMLRALPSNLTAPITSLPEAQQLLVLINGYLLAPLFLIVPLMVSSVLAADAFAGEKERRTMEALLHLPISNRDLFIAKLLGAFIPAVAISWIGFVVFAVVTNAVGWSVMHRIFIPTKLWAVVILWVAPAVAMLGLGVMVRVSARTRTTQEANQLGGAVVLPLIFLAVGQSTGLMLLDLPVALAIGAVIWVVALWLVVRGARLFTRDKIATQV